MTLQHQGKAYEVHGFVNALTSDNKIVRIYATQSAYGKCFSGDIIKILPTVFAEQTAARLLNEVITHTPLQRLVNIATY